MLKLAGIVNWGVNSLFFESLPTVFRQVRNFCLSGAAKTRTKTWVMLPNNGNEGLKTIAVSRPQKPIYHSKALDVNCSFLVSNAYYDNLWLLSGFSKGAGPQLSDSLKSETRCRDAINQHMRYRWNPLDEICSKTQYLMLLVVLLLCSGCFCSFNF